MATLKDIDGRLKKIEERNRRVESQKAWETSISRRALLVLFTYLAAGFYLQAIRVSEPWLNAIMPAAAFMFSTLSLPFFRKLWQSFIYNK